MKVTRTGKRRAAAINSVKILLTSASLAATVGGWAAISAASGSPLQLVQTVNATATVQAWLDSRSTTVAGGAGTNTTSAQAASLTAAPTATPVPFRVVIQPVIRSRSSR